MDIHVSLAAETVFHIGPLPVTNSLLTMVIVMALILLVSSLIARRAQVVPSGRAQGAFEGVVEFLLGLVESTAGPTAGRRIFPLVGGLFIFIICANYSGLLPGVGTIGFYEAEETEASDSGGQGQEGGEEVEIPEPDVTAGDALTEADEGAVAEGEGVAAVVEEGDHAVVTGAVAEDADGHGSDPVLVPYLRAPNADLNMTLALAILTFVIVQVAGIAAHGVRGRIKHMADPPFLFPIEVISEFSRIISLSARLFGNVFAGEVLLAVMFAMAAAIRIAIVPFAFPVVFLGLELLFGAVQALVFSLLTLIYITLATAGGHDDEAREAHVEGAHGIGNVPAGAAD